MKPCMNSVVISTLVALVALAATATAQTVQRDHSVKRLLLIGGPFDGHPKGTHEFMAGMRIISKCLEGVNGLQTTTVNSKEPWKEGPELIDGADGIVLFRGEGARWMHNDPARLAAFERLGKRGGGCVALHYAMTTVAVENIERFVALFGGCHGGPDRRDGTFSVEAINADELHPICRGIRNFNVRDEFYYKLKFVKPPSSVTPLIRANIAGRLETIAWALERDGGGRSFCFSGLHFHERWQLPEYRRLVTQGILWTMDLPILEGGVNVDVPDEVLQLK